MLRTSWQSSALALSTPAKKMLFSFAYCTACPQYQEAVKKMIDPESSLHAAVVYSSRFKIIACFPPPIFCPSTAIIRAILAAYYSEGMAAIVFSSLEPSNRFLNCVISLQQDFKEREKKKIKKKIKNQEHSHRSAANLGSWR